MPSLAGRARAKPGNFANLTPPAKITTAGPSATESNHYKIDNMNYYFRLSLKYCSSIALLGAKLLARMVKENRG